MLRARVIRENEPDFRPWIPEERASWLAEKLSKGLIQVDPKENQKSGKKRG